MLSSVVKKITVTVCIICRAIYCVEAQTVVPSGLVSGTWTIGGSPYIVQGSLLIPNDSTLVIEPGVMVLFQGSYKFNVQGRLLAIGTANDSITFTAINTSIGWKGIRFDNTASTNDSSKIQFCSIKYAIVTGTSPENYGGGLYINNVSKIIVSNSNISNCKAMRGAGIYVNGYNCNPTITKNTIVYNTNDSEGGGAIFCDYGANPLIVSNTISYNSAMGAGAYAGGITCSGSPTIINNIISHNSSFMNGGGIQILSGSNTIASNNTISNNSSSTFGGGIYCGSISYPVLKGNNISNNLASKGAGVFFTASANATLSQSIICNNTATADGGGIYMESSSVPIITNSTIVNNDAINGGGLYFTGAANPNIQNSILYGNTATAGNEVYIFDEGSDPTFTYCNIQGGMNAIEMNGNFYTGLYNNNIATNPLFVAATSGSGQAYNGLTADWSLQNNSPCIDAGNPTTTPDTIDFAGNSRVTVCRIDIGAYEYQTGTPFKMSLSISQAILCHDDTTGAIEAIVSGGSGNYLYNWSNGQTDSIATGLAGGTYTLTVSETSYGCSITDSISLTEPSAVTINAGVDKTIICGGSVVLDNVSSNYTGPGTPTYLWTPTLGLNNDSIINPICSAIIDTEYFITIKTPNGCEDTDTINVTVLPLTVNAGGSIIISCDGVTEINSLYTNYTGTDTLNYLWSPSTGLNNDTIANPTVNLQTPTNYQISVTTKNGCVATDSLSVIVTPLTISSGGNNTNITTCNDTIALNTITNYQGIDTLNYLWTPAQGLSDSTIANPIVIVDTIKTYTVTITTTNGCTASTQIMANIMPIADSAKLCIVGVDSSNKNVIIWNKPASSIIDSFYIYKETNITNNYMLIGAVSYDSLSIYTDTSSNPSVQSNKYRISIKDKCGIETPKGDAHKTMHLAINQGQGNTWNLIWDAYEGFTVSTYNIYRGATPNSLALIGTSSGSNSQYTDLNPPTGNVFYQVEVVGPNFCNPTRQYNTSRSNIATNNINTIFENNNSTNVFEIFPNPCQKNITITTQKTFESATIIIASIDGKKIVNTNLKNQNKTQIEIEYLSAGVYFIILKTENGIYTQKLIKQ